MITFKSFSIQEVFLLLLIVCFADSYKKDHGFGYKFKHDPNGEQRDKTEKLTNSKIRNAIGGIAGNGTMFPDPYNINDMEIKFSGTTLAFTGARVYGLDRYRPLEVRTDFTNLDVTVRLSLDEIQTVGVFQWIGNSKGTFTHRITDAWLTFDAKIELLNEGSDHEGFTLGPVLETRLSYENLELSFEHIPGILSTLLKPIKGSLQRNLFTQLKPMLTREAERNFKRVLKNVFDKLPKESTKAVNIVDRALIRARKNMKTSELDPLYITDHYPKSGKLLKLELTQGKLEGLSTMKRIEPIYIAYERDAVHMHLHFGVQNLKGQYTWTWTLWKHLITQRGILRFNVNDVKVKVNLEKRLNSELNSTHVKNITMEIGSVSLVSEGIGAVKYVMETFLNVVPDSFRQRIMESAEYRLLTVIEDEMGKIDLEEIVEDDAENSLESP